MRELLRSILAEPEVPNPPGRVWRDWVLVGLAVPAALVEPFLRPDLPWRWASLLVALAIIPTLLWRRTDALAVVVLVFAGISIFHAAGHVDGVVEPGLYAMAVLILLPYALTRWASGRHVLIALPFILVPHPVMSAVFNNNNNGVGEAVTGFAILSAVLAAGVAVRFRVSTRANEIEQAKLREREHLARELHDTVAHHVSAMAVRAQAGLVASAARPAAATEALHVIEAEASRALTEMRAMVRILRHDDRAERAPTPGIADITRLADAQAPGPPVQVAVHGDLAGLSSAVSSAVYRLAQEAITNARRHAQGATHIAVEIRANDEAIHLRVHDDGTAVGSAPQTGYGLVGMKERATLIGGTCSAGPDRVGWTVTAALPRNGAST